MEELLTKFAEHCASLEGYTIKTAVRESLAKDFLRSEDSAPATVLLMALRTLYGIDVLYWEPETMWLTVERDHGIDIPLESRDKIQAAITLIRNPSFFWDNLVFQRTTKSFNGEEYDPEALLECSPAHMNWAVYEASVIRGMDPEDSVVPELDEDVQQYVAVCLFRAGYVYPPSQLKPVAPNLRKLVVTERRELIDEVKKSWDRMDKRSLPDHQFQETPLDIQLAKLASCHLYVRDQANRLASGVMSLETPAIS